MAKIFPRISALVIALSGAGAFSQTTATIDIDPAHTTPLNSHFSGFNDEVVFPAEYFDYRFNNIAAQLSPGWVRYPSGIFADAFNWKTGLMVADWASQFNGTNIGPLINSGVPWVNGKGGGSFVDAANRANFLGAKLIVDFNAYTDKKESAGEMAAFAKANHIPVAVWELANEPYLYKGFFSSATDYLNWMKPFSDAIKKADPNAIVAIFSSDPAEANPNPPWNQEIAAYPVKYWDAVTYHHYPAQSTGAFSQWMADENAILATKTSAYVTGYLAPMSPPGTKFLISEFMPTGDSLGTGTSQTDGTLYGAIYTTEYVMRMSSVPSMLYVGPHEISGTRGVDAANSHYADVQDAYNKGTTINTLTLDFGYYLVAQPLGVAVLNGALRNATRVEATTVTGAATVPATGLGTIPALYAQAYATPTGQQSVVITNKSATAHQVTIRIAGTSVSGTLPVQMISGSDPTVQNTSASPNAVSIQSSTSANPVTVPAYSVVRVDLNSPAVATAVSSASFAPGPVAPQEIVTLFGPGIATQTAAAASLPLPTMLGGTSVQIVDSGGNTQLAPLFAVSSGQANILIPTGLVAGPAKVTVLHGSTSALTGSMTIGASVPGLYSANADGAGVAAAVALRVTAGNQTVNPTVFTCNPPALRSCLAAPLSLGSSSDVLYVELYGTGIRSAAAVQCFVAGQSVPVLYAGPVTAYAGLDQVNITIPRSLAGTGTVLVYLVADGVASNVVSLNVQ
jgi:uncharacterized protein (TIGR03437 family)